MKKIKEIDLNQKMIKTLKIFITILMMIDSLIKVELTPNRVDK